MEATALGVGVVDQGQRGRRRRPSVSAAGAMAPGSEDGARRVDGDRGGGRGQGACAVAAEELGGRS